jgi:hypothetical protein
MCFLIIADHLLEHVIEIGNNWQNRQLHTITHDYFTNAQSNLAEPQIISNYETIMNNYKIIIINNWYIIKCTI